MKLTALLSRLNHQYHHLLRTNDILRFSLPSFIVFVLIAITVLLCGQYLNIGHSAPLADMSKRIECILGIFLIWIMKWMLFDLAHPIFTWKGPAKLKDKWRLLEDHLRDAWSFLRTTQFKDHGKKEYLSTLPWFLLIGPHHSGKTSLLSNASIKYILQKKPTNNDTLTANSAHFWATRHAVFVETRGEDLGFSLLYDGRKLERETHDTTWRYFLYWVKKTKRTHGVQGVILTLPYTLFSMSEKMQRYATRRLIERLSALTILKKERVPVYIVVTQCDRMSGFAPFFHGLSQEESDQLFGIQLSDNHSEESLISDVKEQCSRLIKQINQQLIYKLHHEPNASVKPFIKEFPLQLEQLKRSLCDLIKRLTPVLSTVKLEGVFFCSALQEKRESATYRSAIDTNHQAISLYSESDMMSRPYFIKAVLIQLPSLIQRQVKKSITTLRQRIRFQYVLPLLILLLASGVFAADFFQGLAIERSVRQVIAQYQKQGNSIAVAKEELLQTIQVLDELKQIEVTSLDKMKYSFFTFYTRRSLTHAHQMYLKAINSYLLPALQGKLSDALSQYTNYEAQAVYAMLKSYLMLNQYVAVDTLYLRYALLTIEPFHSKKIFANALFEHLPIAFQNKEKSTLTIDEQLVQKVRQYLWYLSKERLGYIILSNQNNYFIPMTLPWQNKEMLFSIEHDLYVPMLFSAASVTPVLTNDVLRATREAIVGNDVLGLQREPMLDDQEALLMSNIRHIYIQAYANYWEQLLSKVTLKKSADLMEWEKNVILFQQHDSMFSEFLRLVYNNTYFEPIVSISARLQALNLLLDKNKATSQQLSLIQKSLQNVYNYVKPVLLSSNQTKAAFDLTAKRMQDQRTVDPITELRIVADNSPEPIKSWLQQFANQLWSHLMQQSSQYMNVAWQEKIGSFFIAHLSKRYPFDSKAKDDSALDKFKQFFQTSGHLVQFYQQYLDPFIDYEDKAWRWKTLDAERMPFSDELLKQVQLGLRIHDAFFPNGDDDLSVRFGLAAQRWGDELKQVVININNNKLIDNASKKEKHLLEWPNQSKSSFSSVQFILHNQRQLTQQYPGEWGLFRLVEDTFDSMLSKNELMLDLSPDDYAAKYIISTKEPVNPFSTVKLSYFQLPEKLHA